MGRSSTKPHFCCCCNDTKIPALRSLQTTTGNCSLIFDVKYSWIQGAIPRFGKTLAQIKK